MKRSVIGAVVSSFMLSVLGESVPVVAGATMAQDSLSRTVTITYNLENAPGIITVDVLTNGVSIGDANLHYLSGDVNRLVDTLGAHTIRWQPDKSWPGNKITDNSVSVKVTAWAKNAPPSYMVVDLQTAANIAYYTSEDALPGGVTNRIYKTEKLLMRRIYAPDGGKWIMGDASAGAAPHEVDLTDDYWMGVYEITQRQWELITGQKGSYFQVEGDCRPVEQVGRDHIRENSDSTCRYPADPHPDSFLGKLRAKTGIAFDLPSEMRWEYACRAGHGSGFWGNGIKVSLQGEWGEYDASLDYVGRYLSNGGTGSFNDDAYLFGPEKGTAIVGSYQPNSWGLYDTHGNAWEWCLDFYRNDISALRGGVNTEYSDYSVIRGGSIGDTAVSCQGAYRISGIGLWAAQRNFGLRVCVQ